MVRIRKLRVIIDVAFLSNNAPVDAAPVLGAEFVYNAYWLGFGRHVRWPKGVSASADASGPVRRTRKKKRS